MTLRTPRTSENPTAMQLYRPPRTSPFTTTWTYSTDAPAPCHSHGLRRLARSCARVGAGGRTGCGDAPLASRHRLQIGLLDRVGIDHAHFLVLGLEDRRRVGIGLAVRAELDRREEGFELGIGEHVSHLVTVEAAGLLDRHLQNDADRRARGLGEIGLAAILRGEQLDEVLSVTEQVVGLVAHRGV